IATMPHEQDCMVEDLDITEKTALVFGTEHTGISDEVIKHADGFVKMPMYGFTESYNISVCAALMLYATTAKMRTSDINWQLSPEEELDVKLRWQSMTIKKYDTLLDLAIKRLKDK
ncbi:MAG TPA: TrmH family RNA methyltransferase, partial [Porphyromonadaceae bacterium]|nr:TrmH family RNA methyltransferase [Porphyromonadaceae bacterium]